MARWIAEEAAYLATLVGFKLGCLLVRILPRRWLFGCSDLLARAGFLLFRKFRRISTANIVTALPLVAVHQARAVAERSLRSFFRACLEILVAMESSDEERRATIAVSGMRYLEDALSTGKGVILLSAHLGNFFLLGTRLAMEGHRIHVLINHPRDGQFAKLMDDYRRQIRLETIHARPRLAAVTEISGVLKQGGIVIIIADEYRRGNGVPATLFGHTVFARRGPAIFAARTGAAIVPACVLRQSDDSLKLVIEPELKLRRPGRTPEETGENTRIITQWVEKTVRAHPDQWNWMNIRWWSEGSGTPQNSKSKLQLATAGKGN
jgi:KDO2-lipid IV(A) lauroyltransferase